MQPNFTQCFKISGIISYKSMGFISQIGFVSLFGSFEGTKIPKILNLSFFFNIFKVAFLVTGGYVSIFFSGTNRGWGIFGIFIFGYFMRDQKCKKC